MTGRIGDPERWARVQDRFLEALDLAPPARAELLRRLEQDDPALADEVVSLLRAHHGEGPLAASSEGPPAGPAGRIGPYRLMESLGVGGMGMVYLAEREGPDFTQRVALKLIRAGYADPRLERRLRKERQILARLEHPGIARLIDGGTTETGQSYFAMEYVEGTGLRDYCDEHALGLRERLRLFLDICEALDHAHRQLVVHGDLKPGNILVTPDGRPKLLDFGIAELLDTSGDSGEGPRTTPWLTPDYASPEQIKGQPLGTAADVYALGVVLFELLTGRRPFNLGGLSRADIERIVTEKEPPRPSAVMKTPATRRALAGDLDTIVLKALAKEPARRYGTAERFAGDLRRYLEGRPVLARPDSAGYRLGKFVRRHRTLVGLLALLFVSLSSGIVAVSRQAAVARRQRDAAETAQRDAEAVSAFLIDLFESSDPRRSGGDTVMVNALLRQGLARLDELQGEPALQARLLDALGEVNRGMLRLDEAMELHQRALALRRAELGERHPDVALSYTAIGLDYRARGAIQEADSLISLAIALERETLGPHHPQLARTLLAAANVAVARVRLEEGERYAREAREIVRAALPPTNPLFPEATRVLASLLRRQNRLAEAEQMYQEYLDLNSRVFGPEHPATAAAMLHLGDLYYDLLGRPAQAESLFRRALHLQERVWEPLHPGLVHGRNSLSALLADRGDLAPAESLKRQNLASMMRSMGSESWSVGSALRDLSGLVLRQGRLAEAEQLAESALAIQRRILRPDDPGIAGALFTLAQVRVAQHRREDALALGREGLTMNQRAFGELHPLTARAYEDLAELHVRLGETTEAEAWYVKALGVWAKIATTETADYQRADSALRRLRTEGGER